MIDSEFLTLVKEINDLLNKDFSFKNFEILTGKITKLDTLIKEDENTKYSNIYEDIHMKFGNYRWVNYL